MYNNATINRQLKNVLEDTLHNYQRACEQSRMAYMETLPPGSQVPVNGRIYTDDARDKFQSVCMANYQQACDIFDSIKKDLDQRMTEPPSEEALRICSLLKYRGNDLTGGEVEVLLDRFGDNPQVFKAITAIAHEHDIHVDRACPIEAEIKDIQRLEQNVTSAISPQYAESGSLTEGYISMLNMDIDFLFPAE